MNKPVEINYAVSSVSGLIAALIASACYSIKLDFQLLPSIGLGLATGIGYAIAGIWAVFCIAVLRKWAYHDDAEPMGPDVPMLISVFWIVIFLPYALYLLIIALLKRAAPSGGSE